MKKIITLTILIIVLSIFTTVIKSNLEPDNLFTRPYEPIPYVDIKNLTEFDFHEHIETFEEDLAEKKEELEIIERRIKLSACLVLIRNTMNKGDNEIIKTLKETKHDKEITFDKIYGMMLNTCVSQMDDYVADKILDYNVVNKSDETSYSKYIAFNSSVFKIIGPTPKLSKEEADLVNEANAISKDAELKDLEEEEIVTVIDTISTGRKKYMFVGMIVGFIATLLVKDFVYALLCGK